MDRRKLLALASDVRDAARRTCIACAQVSAAAFGLPGGDCGMKCAIRFGESRDGGVGAVSEALAARGRPFVAFVSASRAELPQAARADPNTSGVHVRAEGSRTRRTPLEAGNAKRVVAVALLALRVSH